MYMVCDHLKRPTGEGSDDLMEAVAAARLAARRSGRSAYLTDPDDPEDVPLEITAPAP